MSSSNRKASTNNGADDDGSKSYDVSIHWYRNGLRFHDNPSLRDACLSSKYLLPLYVIDPDAPFAQTHGRGAGIIRANFVLESMKEVDDKIKKMATSSGRNDDGTSRLVVVLGKPEKVIPKIVRGVKASALFYEQEAAKPVRESDAAVFRAMKKDDDEDENHKCEIKGYGTHTLHPMETYLAKCKDGNAPSSYGGFTKIFQQMNVPKEVDDVETVPPLPPSDVMSALKDELGDDLCDNGIPTLADLGYDDEEEGLLENRKKGGIDFNGGEDAALKLLLHMMKRSKWVATFEKPKTSPNALTVDTTGLSPCKFVLFVSG